MLTNLCLSGKMEPVAISASIKAIISLTQDFTRFVQAITNVEDSNFVVRYRLIAQKKNTDARANRMRISNEDVIRTKIPREEYENVMILLTKPKRLLAEAEKRYEVVKYVEGQKRT